MTITVNYVSGVPGLGKTRAAIDFMRRHIEGGLAGKDVGYLFYVAPTVDLLNQTIKNLKALLDPALHVMIRAEYSIEGEQYNKKLGTVDTRIRAVLNDNRVGGKGVLPFCEGSILFMTHSSFIKLRKHDKFDKTTVLFDEARKWATEMPALELDAKSENLFRTLFSTSEFRNSKGAKVSGGFLTIHPNKIKPSKLASLVNDTNTASVFRDLYNMYQDLTPNADEPIRMQVFGLMKSSGNKKCFVRVALPSQPFVGFKRILILSADFETSQMYHLLKMEGCQVNNITIPFLDRHLKGGFGRANRVITERYQKLTIVPLTLDREMPSKHQLAKGLLIPDTELVGLKEKMAELNMTTAQLHDIVRAIRHPDSRKGVLTKTHKTMLEHIRGANAELDIMDWMIKSSHKIAKAWMARFKATDKNGVPQPGVMIVNNKYVDYPLQREVFQSLNVGKVEGRNEFMHSNVVAFLAAINPRPDIARLLNAILPEYDAHEDYVVDKAIQSIGRGNIRNHNSDKKMLAIVSTVGLAEKIQARMSHYPRIRLTDTEELGNMQRWSYNQAGAKTREASGVHRRDRFDAKLGDNKKLYSSLSMQISRLKKKLALDPDDRALQKELGQVIEARASLRTKES